MILKKIAASALAIAMSGTVLVSCSQPNAENLLPFIEEEVDLTPYTSMVEGSALTIYVDANAKDGGDGSESAPFKTIQDAQAKIRELKSGEGLPVGGITVLVKDGEYRITESLTFTEEDSGTAESPITYVSENEFGAVLTGGLILSASDFEPLNEDEKARLIDDTAKEKVVKVDLLKYGIDTAQINSSMELFINDERQQVSRWPNAENVYIKKVIDHGDIFLTNLSTDFDKRNDEQIDNPTPYAAENPKGSTFTVEDYVLERMSKWQSFNEVLTVGYFHWSWSQGKVGIENVDFDAGTIEHLNPVSYGTTNKAPFYFHNVYEEIDVVGEYYIDTTNGVLYLYPSSTFDSDTIMISVLDANIVSATDISFCNFKGFSLCATKANGVSLVGNNVVFDNVKIYNIRGNAFNASGNNLTVQNCEIYNLGSFGIVISGGDPATLTPSNNLVYNNYIHDFSVIQRTYTPAISFGGCGNTASHNEIANSPHEAVSWSGPNHIFEYNEVYNVCTETSDCAAFYAGRNLVSYGCIMRYNYIHDIGSGTAYANGIYWDDGLSGQTAYGNLIVNATGEGFQVGGGRDNVVENNIVINSGRSALHYDQRGRDEMLEDDCWFTHDVEMAETLAASLNDAWYEAFPIYKEMILYTEDYAGDLDDPRLSANPANSSMKNNIAYVEYPIDKNINPEALVHSIDEDVPNFVDFTNNPIIINDLSDIPGFHNGDYTLREDAKAFELCPDFEPIPFDQIGRID